MKVIPLVLLASIAIPALVSCSSVRSTMRKMGDPATSLARLKFPGKPGTRSKTPPVVKVRQEDLREIQLGHEKAMVWAETRRNRQGFLDIPTNFDPSKLPVGGPTSATGILPPIGSETDSPGDLPNLPDLSDSDFGAGDQ